MVYTVFYKTSSFAGYCFLDKNSINPKRYDVFSFKAFNAILVKIQFCSFIAGNAFCRAERETGRNKRMSGGFCLCTGITGIYAGVCRLRTGTGSYGASERERGAEVGGEDETAIKSSKTFAELLLMTVGTPPIYK